MHEDLLPSVEAELGFVVPPHGKAFRYVFEPPPGQAADNCQPDPRRVLIADARCAARAPRLGVEGFECVRQVSRVKDFDDEASVVRDYHAECRALVQAMLGASEVIVFDHLVRKRHPAASTLTALGRGQPSAYAGPAGRVHVDYTVASAEKRLRLVLGLDPDADYHQRFAIVNIWRSACGPILDAPLALCDVRSLDRRDLVATELRYPKRTGEIYQLAYNPAQRWSYFNELQADEALVFKQYDGDAGRPRLTPHGAFVHPGTPATAPARQSIEVRCLALFA
ncbi:CmcJ/NvfI family oxidoreductase [Ideonella sp. BN130291]|uniref:CmcJ/NvfI family oxidoreductase n=1 Tax=Ideonella sp. BN130291 TaxID=3112940 RepID=UPI002E25662D|nr:CmcJ/NvfI family oxidoreductase [Ideonella sp. BN130291]